MIHVGCTWLFFGSKSFCFLCRVLSSLIGRGLIGSRIHHILTIHPLFTRESALELTWLVLGSDFNLTCCFGIALHSLLDLACVL